MKIKPIDYVNELNEECIKLDLESFKKFFIKWMSLFKIIDPDNPPPDSVIEITLYKTAYNNDETPDICKDIAKEWLLSHGYDLEIFKPEGR